MRQERNDKIGKGIEEDIDAAARTHLKNHVTTLELVSVFKHRTRIIWGLNLLTLIRILLLKPDAFKYNTN